MAHPATSRHIEGLTPPFGRAKAPYGASGDDDGASVNGDVERRPPGRVRTDPHRDDQAPATPDRNLDVVGGPVGPTLRLQVELEGRDVLQGQEELGGRLHGRGQADWRTTDVEVEVDRPGPVR